MLTTLRLLIFGPLCVALLVACGSKVNPLGPYPTGGGGTTVIDGGTGEAGAVPSYTYDIIPMLKKSCSCHVQNSQTPLLDTYTNVAANAAVSLQSMKTGLMPPDAPATSSDIDLLQRWINGNTPAN